MGVDVSTLHVEPLNQVAGEAGLVEVDRSLLVVVTPREVCAKKPLNHTHEFDFDESRQDALKACFDFVAAREVDKVIYIQAKCEGHG